MTNLTRSNPFWSKNYVNKNMIPTKFVVVPELLARLYVMHDDVGQVPGLHLSDPAVVVPNADVRQVAQGSATILYIYEHNNRFSSQKLESIQVCSNNKLKRLLNQEFCTI